MIFNAMGDFGVVVSDLHIGSSISLLPSKTLLDDGQIVEPGEMQAQLKKVWGAFWKSFVPSVIGRRPYWLALLGDTVEGRHHDTSEVVTANLTDQCKLATQVVREAERMVGQLPTQRFLVRGTPAHDGKSGCLAELVGEQLRTCHGENRFSHRHILLKWKGRYLDLAHHIGISGSPMTECSALVKELTKAAVEAGQWADLCPDLVLRGHRHRMAEAAVPTVRGTMRACTLPGWQYKTEFADKVDPIRRVQVGGTVVGVDDFGQLYLRHFLWSPRYGDSHVSDTGLDYTDRGRAVNGRVDRSDLVDRVRTTRSRKGGKAGRSSRGTSVRHRSSSANRESPVRGKSANRRRRV